MNPYTGCTFGCGYCYAAEFQQDDARRAAWGQWVRIKERAGREIEEFPPGSLSGKSLSFGTVTDPYQPLEAKTQLTRRMLTALAGNPRLEAGESGMDGGGVAQAEPRRRGSPAESHMLNRTAPPRTGRTRSPNQSQGGCAFRRS